MDDTQSDFWAELLKPSKFPERLQKCGYDFAKIKEKLLWFKENAQDYPLDREDREKLAIPFYELVIALEPIVSGEPDVKKVGRLVEEFLKGLDEVRVKVEKWLARQKALKGPCAPLAKKLGEKRQKFKEKQAALQKIQGLFNILDRAGKGQYLPIWILIAKGSIYDYTRPDRTVEQSRVVQRRLDEHLKAAREILQRRCGINVQFEYAQPAVVDVGTVLNLGQLKVIGGDYGTDCMPVLVFTNDIQPPAGEPRSVTGMAYTGLADPAANVAAVNRDQYSQMRLGRHILHNLAHLLGIQDNKNNPSDEQGEPHVGNVRSPGAWFGETLQNPLSVEIRTIRAEHERRLKVCRQKKQELDEELKKRKAELDKLGGEIEQLDKELEECLKKAECPRQDLREVERVRERCEALRYGWPELRRRYDELGRQVHLANDELDKAKEMLEEIRRLLLLMDECVAECEKSARKPDEGTQPPDGGEARPRSGEPPGTAPDTEGGLARKRITVDEPAGPPQQGGEGPLEPIERLWKLIKKIFKGEPSGPSTTMPSGGTERATEPENESPRSTESETGGEAGGGETSTTAQQPAGTEGVTGGGETSLAAQTAEPVKKTIKLDVEQIHPPSTEAGGELPSKAARVPRPKWRAFGGEISLPGLGSVGVIPLVEIATVSLFILTGLGYGGYRLIETIGEAAAPRPVEAEKPGIAAPPEAASPAPPAEELAIRLATLDCHIDAHLGYVDLKGPPGYYWRIYFSTNEPVPGVGDAFSESVRLDIENAQYWDFEEHSYGYFNESGSALFSFPLQMQTSQTLLWMQAVVVENPDILISNPTPGQVILTEVCHIAY